MRRVVQLIILLFIISFLVIQPSYIGNKTITKPLSSTIVEGPYGGVRLNKDQISLLYINGSFYQMGLQLGSLLQEEFSRVIDRHSSRLLQKSRHIGKYRPNPQPGYCDLKAAV